MDHNANWLAWAYSSAVKTEAGQLELILSLFGGDAKKGEPGELELANMGLGKSKR